MRRTDVLLTVGLFSAFGCAQLQGYLDGIGVGADHGGQSGGGHGSGAGHAQPPAPSCGATIGVDQLLQTVSADVAAADADDQPFLRYLTLAGRFNAGVCGAALAADRAALSELVNVLSTSPRLTRPVAIDADELTYRIDIRDYDWNRTVALSGETFTDGWELVTAISPFAVQYQGPDADSLVEDTGTRVPLMSFAAFADAAMIGEAYYTLIDIPETEGDLFVDLGIDVANAIASGDAVRGVTAQSLISRQPRAIERFPQEVRSGALWRTQDFGDDTLPDLFADPLSRARDESVTFFTLPNGLNGFVLFDADGTRIEASDVLLDTAQNDFRARVATSCLNCHARGALPFEDEARDVVLGDPASFDPEVVAAVERIFPPNEELAEIIAADSSAFVAALGRIGIAPGQADPLGSAVLQFDQDLDARALAAETYVSLGVFRARRGQLPEPLRLRSTDRDDFAAVYLEAVCTLQSDGANTPVGCAAL